MSFRRYSFLTGLLALLVAAAGSFSPAYGQPTNMDVAASLTADCVLQAPLPGAVRLVDDPRYELVSTAVIRRVHEADVRVFADEAPSADTLASLFFALDDLTVSYARAGGDLARSVEVMVNVRLTSAQGEILHVDRCERSSVDRVARRDVSRIESPAYPETTAPMPPGSLRRRVVEPVLLAGATAVAVVLFFTLRSKRTTTE